MGDLSHVEQELLNRNPGWWGRIGRVLPELVDLEGVPQPKQFHREGDVATHSRMAVELCMAGCAPDIVWMALLHDIGKAATTCQQDGGVTAHGHDKVGAEISARVLARLGMPTDRSRVITWGVRHHHFHHSWNLVDFAQATQRHRRFVADPNFPALLELLRVDSLAALGNPSGLGAFDFYTRFREEVCRKEPSP